MHKTTEETERFLAEFLPRVPNSGPEVVICPPFTSLKAAVELCFQSPVGVVAQNMHEATDGAFTGEVSAPMLLDLGVDGVLLGHSERRQYFGETDAALAEKLSAALDAGLDAILAVGESEAEREAGETESVLERQVTVGLAPAGDRVVTIAYEPVWAIGTGKTATPELAQAAHVFIRGLLPESVRDATRIQYGGSMKPENAAELLAQRDIDGGLIGGASLGAEPFLAIRAAARCV